MLSSLCRTISPSLLSSYTDTPSNCTLDDSDIERLKRAYEYITSQLMNARRNTKDLQITLCLLDVILNGSPTRWDPDKTSTHWSPSQTEFVVVEALKHLSSKKHSELFFLGIKRLGLFTEYS